MVGILLFSATVSAQTVERPFALDDLNRASDSQEVAKNVMDRFVECVCGHTVRRSTVPEHIEYPEIPLSFWKAKLDDCRQITWYPGSAIAIGSSRQNEWLPNSNSVPRFTPETAAERARLTATKLQIPREWTLVDDPEVCDFAKYHKPNPYHFIFGILPKGFRYPHPTKRLTIHVDESTGQIASIILSNQGDTPTQVKIMKEEAIERATLAAKRITGSSDPKRYEDQIGLGYGFADELRTNVRTAYVVPFHFRVMVKIDAMTGECLEAFSYK